MPYEPDPGQVRVVLVRTSHPGNIGAAARAMKNMGFCNLTLVRPDRFPDGVATGRAGSALDILENAVVVDSLAEAISDCGLVIGTSARSRSIPIPVLTPDQCAERVFCAQPRNRVALVFGREDSGLSNDELQACHFHVQIPASEQYSSLNLAAAVLLICYEIRKKFLADGVSANEIPEQYWDQEMATASQVENFFEHLERVLVRLDFHDPENPRQLLPRLHRLFGRIRLDAMEINILRGILTHIDYHLDLAAHSGARPANEASALEPEKESLLETLVDLAAQAEKDSGG